MGGVHGLQIGDGGEIAQQAPGTTIDLKIDQARRDQGARSIARQIRAAFPRARGNLGPIRGDAQRDIAVQAGRIQ